MKKELIRTEDYIFVVDEAWKQLAHLPINDAPILEGVPLLPPIEEDGAEDLAKEYLFNVYQKHFNIESNDEQFGVLKGFIGGYNRARETYRFTEDDMKYMFECGRNFQINGEVTFAVAIEHISQPKIPTHFEFDVVWHNTYGSETQQYDAQELKIKTITNAQGQIVACGKYLFE